MIYKENEISDSIIKRKIGNQVNINFKRLESIGSTGYFLKSFNNYDNKFELKPNSKCNIQKFSNGILLRLNYSNTISFLPISKDEIKNINLVRGEEKISPLFLSPMWILLKLKISILTARYFRSNWKEYSIENMNLTISTEKYHLEFIANGYLFEGQYRFFESLKLKNK